MSWNHPLSAEKQIVAKKSKINWFRVCLSFCVLGIIGFSFILLLSSPNDVSEVDRDTKNKTLKSQEPPATLNTEEVEVTKPVIKTEAKRSIQKNTVAVQLPSNVLQTARGTCEILPMPSSYQKEGKRIFDHSVHSMIANYIRPGISMPPPEPVSDAEALEAVITPIRDLESDDEETLEKKECVRQMLKELKQYLEDGKTANQFFRDLDRRQEMEAFAVQETRNNVLELVNQGKIIEAKETLDAYNKYLKEKGLPTVRVKQLSVLLNEQSMENN